MTIVSKPSKTTSTSGIPARVAALRDVAERDPVTAQDAAWAWLQRMDKQIDKDATLPDNLDELFSCGQPSVGIDGPTDYMVIWYKVNPALDLLIATMLKLYNPFLGKRFDAAQSTGDNMATGVGRLLLKVMGGAFHTGMEAGVIEPSVDVLVVDYASVDTNQSFVRRLRDELVEIIPGVHLGRGLVRGETGYRNVCYFALRSKCG